MKTLFLASQSRARRELLTDAQIPFVLLSHFSDELQSPEGLSLEELVRAIALHKMQTIPEIPADQPNCRQFIITADTLCQDAKGTVHAKPTDYDDACRILRSIRDYGVFIGTAFVIRVITYENGIKKSDQQVVGYASAYCEIAISDVWIGRYLETQKDYLNIAGALDIQTYGAQFVKKVDGSITSILGLPMPELRTELENLGFWD